MAGSVKSRWNASETTGSSRSSSQHEVILVDVGEHDHLELVDVLGDLVSDGSVPELLHLREAGQAPVVPGGDPVGGASRGEVA